MYMTLGEAKQIVKIWGQYLEFCQDRLQALFIGSIPESLLPYPIKTLENGLNMVAKYYHDNGNLEAYKQLSDSFKYLSLYVDDEKALQISATKFNDSKIRLIISKKMKKVQENFIENQKK